MDDECGVMWQHCERGSTYDYHEFFDLAASLGQSALRIVIECRVYANSNAVGAFGPESSEAFHAYLDFVLGTLRGAIVL